MQKKIQQIWLQLSHLLKSIKSVLHKKIKIFASSPFRFVKRTALWLGKWVSLLLLSWAVGFSLLVAGIGFLFSSFVTQYYNVPVEFWHEDALAYCDDESDSYILEIDTALISAELYQQASFHLPISLNGGVIEQTGWIALREKLRAAQDDANIKGVLVKYQGFHAGSNGVIELASLLKGFHDSDKPVWVFGHRYGNYHGLADYLLAGGDVQTLLAPSGYTEFKNLTSDRLYFKRFFERWQIQPEFTKRHEYKSFPSTYTERAPRPPEEANTRALLSDIENFYFDSFEWRAENKKALLQQGIFSAADSVKFGLADALVYEDEIEEYLQSTLQEKDIEAAQDTKILPLDCYHLPNESVLASAEKVQIINIIGEIKPASARGGFSGGDILSRIRKAKEDDEITALLVYINSPGGDYAFSERLWHGLYSFDKPVVVLMGNVAASGGYFIAAGADKIFAYPTSVTGSVGIFSGHFALRKFFTDILHIDGYHISTNPETFSTLDKYPEHYRKAWDKYIDALYADFTGKINLKRQFSAADLDKVARGRVFSGRQAYANGLIDGDGGLDEALAWLEQELGAKLILLPEQQEQSFDDLLSQLFASTIKLHLQDSLYRLGFGGGVRMQMPESMSLPTDFDTRLQ